MRLLPLLSILGLCALAAAGKEAGQAAGAAADSVVFGVTAEEAAAPAGTAPVTADQDLDDEEEGAGNGTTNGTALIPPGATSDDPLDVFTFEQTATKDKLLSKIKEVIDLWANRTMTHDRIAMEKKEAYEKARDAAEANRQAIRNAMKAAQQKMREAAGMHRSGVEAFGATEAASAISAGSTKEGEAPAPKGDVQSTLDDANNRTATAEQLRIAQKALDEAETAAKDAADAALEDSEKTRGGECGERGKGQARSCGGGAVCVCSLEGWLGGVTAPCPLSLVCCHQLFCVLSPPSPSLLQVP